VRGGRGSPEPLAAMILSRERDVGETVPACPGVGVEWIHVRSISHSVKLVKPPLPGRPGIGPSDARPDAMLIPPADTPALRSETSLPRAFRSATFGTRATRDDGARRADFAPASCAGCQRKGRDQRFRASL